MLKGLANLKLQLSICNKNVIHIHAIHDTLICFMYHRNSFVPLINLSTSEPNDCHFLDYILQGIASRKTLLFHIPVPKNPTDNKVNYIVVQVIVKEAG